MLSIRQTIKKIKKTKKLTNADIARKVGLSPGRIWQLEAEYYPLSKMKEVTLKADLRKACL